MSAEQKSRADRTTIMKLKLQNSLKILPLEQIFLFVNVLENENDLLENATRTPIMVSKNWTIGRSIDSIKKQLNITQDIRVSFFLINKY